jgi:hypothetical protein
LYDGKGLYLEVLPVGTEHWRFRYRPANGNENSVAFGSYPQLSLVDARNKRTQVQRRLFWTESTLGNTVNRSSACCWKFRLEMDIFPDIERRRQPDGQGSEVGHCRHADSRGLPGHEDHRQQAFDGVRLCGRDNELCYQPNTMMVFGDA